jgi:hypothetical protein
VQVARLSRAAGALVGAAVIFVLEKGFGLLEHANDREARKRDTRVRNPYPFD